MNLQKLPLAAAQKVLDAVNLVLSTSSIDPSLVFQAAQLFTPLVEHVARLHDQADADAKAAANVKP
jgi:hypothetical protein